MAADLSKEPGNERVIAALLRERAGLVQYGYDERVAHLDEQLAARGYKADKAVKAELDAAEAERQRVHDEANKASKADDEAGAAGAKEAARSTPPQGRTGNPGRSNLKG